MSMQICEFMMIIIFIMKVWFHLDIDWLYILIPSVVLAVANVMAEVIVRCKAIECKAKIDEEDKEDK